MKKTLLAFIATFAVFLFTWNAKAQGTVPEILYYQFNQTGTTVNNTASAAPAGTNVGTINGGLTQGGNGLCQTGLIGVGGSSGTNYVDTGWDTDLGTSSWTIAFWVDDIPSSSTLFYQFGDQNASSFRCFTNGAAGATNFMLRGPVTDVTCTGCAPVGVPSMTVFVYDAVAGDIKAYHDGVLNNTVSQGALNISGANFKVGGYSSSTGIGNGQIMDEFRFYDRALDAQEVLDTYNDCLPLSSSPDDAGISSIDGPVNFCAGTEDVLVTIRNYGINQIDSVMVNWTINGAPQTPYNHIGLIDTAGGLSPSAVQVILGSSTFAAGLPYVIDAWTQLPNGVVDTVTNNDSSMVIVQPSLAGNFTIGGTAPDYPDFTSAVADLNAYGVCSPVTFDIRTGTYNEQVSMDQVSGTSSTNTVKFRSEAGHRDSVILTFPSTLSTANYTLRMNGSDHFNIEQITIEATGPTYGRVVEYIAGADSNTMWDCRMVGVTTNSTSTNNYVLSSLAGNDNYNSFIGNSIENGSRGIYWRGGAIADLELGTVFKDNEIINPYQYGAYLYYQDAPIFEDNHSTISGAYTGLCYGLYMGYCDNGASFKNNSSVIGPNNYGYGLFLTNCDGGTSPTERIIVSNNMMSVGNAAATSTSYGTYLTNSSRLDFYNNSVNVESNGASSRAFYVTGGGLISMKNNSFTLNGPGYAAYFNSLYSVDESDYNNYYTAGGSNFVYYNATNIANLTDFQTASGQDANALSVDPMYYAFDDLHVCNDTLDGAGTPLAEVTIDFDGAPRDAATPDIGADEFGPLSGDFLGIDDVICTNDTIMLWAGSPSDSILWSTGDTTMSITVSTPGTYYVDVTGVCGSGSDTIVIDASALSYSNFVDADTTFFCTPGSATLSSSMMGTSYDWSTTETTPTISVTASGTYYLTLTDECGSGMDSVTVVGASAPAPSFTSTTSYVTAFFTNTTVAEGTLTYSWDFGDGSTSTDENPTHIYTAAGTYTVSLTVTNECGSEVTTNTVVASTVGLEEIGNGNSLSIHPNPNNGTFTLDILLTQKSTVDVVVTNELGQKLFSNSLNEVVGSQLEQIDLGNVESGLYFITVVVNDNSYVSKFIVK